jgi:hypothetical protein
MPSRGRRRRELNPFLKGEEIKRDSLVLKGEETGLENPSLKGEDYYRIVSTQKGIPYAV